MGTSRSLLIGIAALLLASAILPEDANGQKKNGPPPWAPAHGYRAKTRHIYFPQHNFYFDMHRGVYIYVNGGTWEVAARLPSRLEHVDLRASAQIELDVESDTPQRFNHDHTVRYAATGEGSAAKSKPSHGQGKKKK